MLDEWKWTTEQEIELFSLVCDHKPVGELKDQNMAQILKHINQNTSGERDISEKQIWDKLKQYYNIELASKIELESDEATIENGSETNNNGVDSSQPVDDDKSTPHEKASESTQEHEDSKAKKRTESKNSESDQNAQEVLVEETGAKHKNRATLSPKSKPVPSQITEENSKQLGGNPAESAKSIKSPKRETDLFSSDLSDVEGEDSILDTTSPPVSGVKNITKRPETPKEVPPTKKRTRSAARSGNNEPAAKKGRSRSGSVAVPATKRRRTRSDIAPDAKSQDPSPEVNEEGKSSSSGRGQKGINSQEAPESRKPTTPSESKTKASDTIESTEKDSKTRKSKRQPVRRSSRKK